MNDHTEKTAGTNLTVVPEYTETALAFADLRQRHAHVVYDVTVPKEMTAAKEARNELRTLRTSLEKKRVEIKAPALERCRLIDAEAKRLTADIVALEEPIDVQIKAEETRKEAEKLAKLAAEQARVDGHRAYIAGLRELPSSLIGRPAAGIEARLKGLETAELPDCEEFAQEADDAYAATVSRLKDMLIVEQAREAEQARVRAQDEEIKRLRAHTAKLQREADEAKAREEQREREVRDQAEHAERGRLEAIARAEREAEQAAERESQAERQRELDDQAEEQRVERERLAAEAKRQAQVAEAARIASLTFTGAVQALVDWCVAEGFGAVQQVQDVNTLLLAEVER